MAHIIGAIKNKSPETAISLLVFKEATESAKILKSIHHIFTLDGKKILSLLKNKIYHHGLAMNYLNSILASAEKTKWDHIYNYSQGPLSSHLTAFLTENSHNQWAGIKTDSNGEFQYSGLWAEIFHSFITRHRQSPFPWFFIHSKITRSTVSRSCYEHLESKKSHTQRVKKYFNSLEKNKHPNAKILGIIVDSSNPHPKGPFLKRQLLRLREHFRKTRRPFPSLFTLLQKGIARQP